MEQIVSGNSADVSSIQSEISPNKPTPDAGADSSTSSSWFADFDVESMDELTRWDLHKTQSGPSCSPEFETARIRILSAARAAIPGISLKDNASWSKIVNTVNRLRPSWEVDAITTVRELEGVLLAAAAEVQHQEKPEPKKPKSRSNGIGQRLFERGMYPVPSSEPYRHIHRAISNASIFSGADETAYPAACICGNDSTTQLELRPETGGRAMNHEQQKALISQMWEQSRALSPADADALDGLMAIWIEEAKSPNDSAVAHLDDLLMMRGLMPRPDGHGRRGGFTRRQRDELRESYSRLQNFWITFKSNRQTGEALRSRAITITTEKGQIQFDGDLDVHAFVFRPGEVLAHYLHREGRQTALLSAKALQYDPYRQTAEKRLTRYLAWQWRIRARSANYEQSFLVSTLINEAGIEFESSRARRAYARLEKALDRLLEDKIINSWQFDSTKWNPDVDEDSRDWAQKWFKTPILIEPPDCIKDHYINNGLEAEIRPVKALAASPTSPAQRLAHERKARHLSQSYVADAIGITQAYLSQIERGIAKNINATLTAKINKWLSELPNPQL